MIARTTGLIVFIAVLASPALAHAFLKQQSPKAGAGLTMPPSAVHLVFTEDLEPALSGVTVTGTDGKSYTTGKPAVHGNVMDVALKGLPPGTYRVFWHAVSVDTHRTEGSYAFTIIKPEKP